GVAEVIPELDLGRYVATQPEQALQDPTANVREPYREDALEHPELEVRVPLDGQLLGGDVVQYLPQLLQHPRLVDRLQLRLVLGGDEGADGGKRRGQRDLEPAA